jgi:hypothetical protein
MPSRLRVPFFGRWGGYMRSKVWSILGVGLTGAMVVLSGAINYAFGYSLGTTAANARIFGAVSVVAVGFMAVLPLRISAHWDEGRKPRAVFGGAVFGILVSYAIASSIGFGMQNRSQLAGSQEGLNARLSDEMQDRDRALARLKGFELHPPEEVVKAKIAAAKKDRRWDQTDGCIHATTSAWREFCQRIDRLTGELGTAATAAVLHQKIDRLNASIEQLRKQGAGQLADPQSFGLAQVVRQDQDTVRVGLSILLALVVESVSCFGLLVMAGGTQAETARDDVRVTPPEWIGRWLTDRTEPHYPARVSLAELEADFKDWSGRTGAPRLQAWRFRRLVRAACREVGLRVEGRHVVGLQLMQRQLASLSDNRMRAYAPN